MVFSCFQYNIFSPTSIVNMANKYTTSRRQHAPRKPLTHTLKSLTSTQLLLLLSLFAIISISITAYLFIHYQSTQHSFKLHKARPINSVLHAEYNICASGPLIFINFLTLFPITEQLSKIIPPSLCSGFFTLGNRLQTLPPDKILTFDDPQSPQPLTSRCPNNDCVLSSNYNQCDYLPADARQSCSYFTFLQNPLDRLITLYVKLCINGDDDIHSISCIGRISSINGTSSQNNISSGINNQSNNL